MKRHLVSKKGVSSPKGFYNNNSPLKDSLHSLSNDEVDYDDDTSVPDIKISSPNIISNIENNNNDDNDNNNNNNNNNSKDDIDNNNNNNTIIYPNGDEYTGNLVNSIKNGHGTLKYASTGAIYTGEFKDDMRNGNGRTITLDSAVYEGKYLNDKKQGYGVLTTPLFTYKGEFQNDEREGYGKLLLKDGDVYEGEWKNGFQHGEGISVYHIGNLYDGYILKKSKYLFIINY